MVLGERNLFRLRRLAALLVVLSLVLPSAASALSAGAGEEPFDGWLTVCTSLGLQKVYVGKGSPDIPPENPVHSGLPDCCMAGQCGVMAAGEAPIVRIAPGTASKRLALAPAARLVACLYGPSGCRGPPAV